MNAQLPAWVPITVALIALIGVLITALITFLNQRETTANAKILVELRERLAQSTQEKLLATQEEQAKRLKEIEHSHRVQLLQLEARLKAEFEAEKIKVMLNEENWKRVHELLLKLRQKFNATAASFRHLAAKGHEMTDDDVFNHAKKALASHDDLKAVISECENQIRPKDFELLNTFQDRLVKVFLDMARHKEERKQKVERMKEHLEKLDIEVKHVHSLIEEFILPRHLRAKGRIAVLDDDRTEQSRNTAPDFLINVTKEDGR